MQHGGSTVGLDRSFTVVLKRGNRERVAAVALLWRILKCPTDGRSEMDLNCRDSSFHYYSEHMSDHLNAQ
jgi:hypothetical protein